MPLRTLFVPKPVPRKIELAFRPGTRSGSLKAEETDESVLLAPENAANLIDAVRAGRKRVVSVELIRPVEAGDSTVSLYDSTPAAAAGSLVSMLADRSNLGVKVTVRRESNMVTGPIRHFDRDGRGHPYRAVAEDIEWFQSEWLTRSDYLTDAEIRRGSTQLNLLLIEDLAGKAWRHYGFEKQPQVDGPDMRALAERDNLRLEMAASAIAGGGRVSDIDMAVIGVFRVDNPTTGVPADADVGFAVSVSSITRDARTAEPGELDPLVHRRWFLSEYLRSPSAVRRGEIITRKEIIDYFRNYTGGAHHDHATGKKHSSSEKYELIAELEQSLCADVRDGLHFELLSIGQAVARSSDMRRLAERIRQDISAGTTQSVPS